MAKRDRPDIDYDVVRDGAEKIRGVFSSQSMHTTGVGVTERKSIRKTYWSGFELPDGRVEIQPLNRHYIPSGPKQIIDRDEFLAKFCPEPEFYTTTVFPAMKEAIETLERTESHRELNVDPDAPVDEVNIRANFGLGLTYLDRGDRTKARDMFDRLAELKASFKDEHKHLFNDFGINMRKNKMFDQALQYYLRAAELVDDDEHLFHNIARCYYDKGDVQECKRYLKKSLEVNPDLRESRLFWEYLKKQGHVGPNERPTSRHR